MAALRCSATALNPNYSLSVVLSPLREKVSLFFQELGFRVVAHHTYSASTDFSLYTTAWRARLDYGINMPSYFLDCNRVGKLWWCGRCGGAAAHSVFLSSCQHTEKHQSSP